MSAVDLYWLPLGAGGHSVRLNGLVFEAIAARLQHRGRARLFHSALEVRVPEGRFVIEQAPAWGTRGERGVVAEGPVGSRAAGRFRWFRYEVRRWRDGVIPDAGEAVESPQRVSDDLAVARRVLELVPELPTPVWGRDELRTGEMWNSNSCISWLLVRSGLDVSAIRPPAGGRAPGWQAGVVVAQRALAAEGRGRQHPEGRTRSRASPRNGRRRRMPSAANEVVIARPPDEVFAFLAERENDLRWRVGVLDIEHVAGEGVGARYTQGVKGPGGRRIAADIEITELEPGRAIGFATVAGPVRPRGRYVVSPADGGTRVRFELEAEVGGLKRLLAPMVQKTMAAEVGRLERLKQLLETTS